MYMWYLWYESDFLRYMYKKLQKFQVRDKKMPIHRGLYFISSFSLKIINDTYISSTADNITIYVERNYMPVHMYIPYMINLYKIIYLLTSLLRRNSSIRNL